MYYLACVKHETCNKLHEKDMFLTYILTHDIINHVTFVMKNLLSEHVNDIIIKMFTLYFYYFFFTIYYMVMVS